MKKVVKKARPSSKKVARKAGGKAALVKLKAKARKPVKPVKAAPKKPSVRIVNREVTLGAENVAAIQRVIADSLSDHIGGLVESLGNQFEGTFQLASAMTCVDEIRKSMKDDFYKVLMASNDEDLGTRIIDGVPAAPLKALLDMLAMQSPGVDTLATGTLSDITSDDDAGYSHSDPVNLSDDAVRELTPTTVDDEL